jgi:excisionase family DNA binding protein
MNRNHSENSRRPGAAPDELLTSAEVADIFGVDRRTVVLWAKRGRLNALRTPGGQHRFRRVEIDDLLRTSRESDGGSRATGCAVAGGGAPV